MKRTVLLVILFCACSVGHPRTPQEQARNAVALRSVCGSTASGVIVNDRDVLTAAHFVISCQNGLYELTTVDGKQHAATLTGMSRTDVARLTLLDRQEGFDARRPQTANARGRVCLESGSPERGRSCGDVLESEDGYSGIQHTAPVKKGNSGSGLYDSRGRLVGIVVTCNPHPTTPKACAMSGGGASRPGMIR